MANPHQPQAEEEDLDILALREMALMTRKKKNSQSVATHPAFPEQKQSPILLDRYHTPTHPLPINGMGNFNGQHPTYSNQVPEMYPGPGHQPMYNYHQLPRPSFPPRRPPFVGTPMMPVVPHVNPHFVAQPHPPMFVPTGSEILPLGHGILPEEDMPVMPVTNGVFIPTPPSRLSPRSAQFVAMNNEALRRNVRRSVSPKRSRSRSPYKYRYNSRSRSRSPHYKTQVSHIARKRTRSPDKAYTNKFNRNSPLRRPEKRPSPKVFENRRNRTFNRNNENGNSRDRCAKQNIELKNPERVTPRTSPKLSDREKSNDASTTETVKKSESPSPATTQAGDNREKTEQELEDELLASTDSEQSEIEAGDDDEFKVTLDKDDLDFLDDEEDEESENEGRFKSKSTTSSVQPKKQMATNNFKSNYSRGYDNKSKAYGDKHYGRNDYPKRPRYDEPRRDRKKTRSPIESQRSKDEKRYDSPIRKHKKSPEIQKSLEPFRTTTSKDISQPAKIVVDKQEESKKRKSEEALFKSTFKTVDSAVDDKKKDEDVKKDERVRLKRGSVINRIEPLKTEKPEKSKEDARRPAIMKRLGGYIKDPAKVSKTWAKEQIVRILCENLIRDLRFR